MEHLKRLSADAEDVVAATLALARRGGVNMPVSERLIAAPPSASAAEARQTASELAAARRELQQHKEQTGAWDKKVRAARLGSTKDFSLSQGPLTVDCCRSRMLRRLSRWQQPHFSRRARTSRCARLAPFESGIPHRASTVGNLAHPIPSQAFKSAHGTMEKEVAAMKATVQARGPILPRLLPHTSGCAPNLNSAATSMLRCPGDPDTP